MLLKRHKCGNGLEIPYKYVLMGHILKNRMYSIFYAEIPLHPHPTVKNILLKGPVGLYLSMSP